MVGLDLKAMPGFKRLEKLIHFFVVDGKHLAAIFAHQMMMDLSMHTLVNRGSRAHI